MTDFESITSKNPNRDLSVTFQLNKDSPFYSWYPYTEGYSGDFVERVIKKENITQIDFVLDPYAGCGTTAVACSLNGINSLSIDVNPFMCFVTQVKTRINIPTENLEKEMYDILNKSKKMANGIDNEFLVNQKFFPIANLKKLLKLKRGILASEIERNHKDIFLLALASITVEVSHMRRCADLRYRRSPNIELNVFEMFKFKALRYIHDLSTILQKQFCCEVINDDITNSQKIPDEYYGRLDYFITSPPYLNGTNYIRNSKLELALLDFVRTQKDLITYHKKLITGGINSVKNDASLVKFPFVEELRGEIEKVAYDKRIPRMIEGYFSDIYKSLIHINRLLKTDAKGYIVIGDSNFAKVHVPTDIIFAKLCQKIGWKVNNIEIARERKSKNGSKLRESIIKVTKC